MTAIRVLLRRLSGLFQMRLLKRDMLERDMDDEFDFHLQSEVAENLRRGMSPDDALIAARRRFGGIAQVKEAYREAHSLPFLQVLWQDLRFGFRMLRRNPGFSILALFCLTLGIGATTAVFSWIEGVLLRPFPGVAHQERMMAVAGTYRGVAGAPGDSTDISWPDFQDFQRNCKLFDAFIVDRITGVTLAIGDRADRARPGALSRPTISMRSESVRSWGAGSNPPKISAVMLIPSLSSAIRCGKNVSTPIRRSSAGCRCSMACRTPSSALRRKASMALSSAGRCSSGSRYPCRNDYSAAEYKLEDRGAQWIEGFVRLKPGVTPQQAQAEISAVAMRLEHDYPATNRGRGVRLFPLWKTPFNNAGTLFPTLSVALAVVCFVLLIACANVGNLLLVKAFGRRHEMTRAACGGRRTRAATETTAHRGFDPVGDRGGLWSPCRKLVPQPAPAAAPIARWRLHETAR